MSKISVVGLGYVGLTTAACLADLGHDVVGMDIDTARVQALKRGKLPFYEPGLVEMIQRNLRGGRISFVTTAREATAGQEFVFMAVNTPPDRRGGADLTALRAAARSIGAAMEQPLVIINKSTVPIGTGDLVSQIVSEAQDPAVPFEVVSNPEFLREGSAITDFMNPDRVVLGAHNPQAAQRVAELYRTLDAPVLITNLYTAEMIKYASNAFLATKISFINEIARICEGLEADVAVVAEGMGMDKRIGRAFLDAGIGFGGSCFPKDVRALARMAQQGGYHPELLLTVMEINRDMRRLVIQRLKELLGGLRGQTIAIFGVSFKPNTDDLREAPAVEIIDELLQKGASVRIYDPAAMAAAKHHFNGRIVAAKDAYSAAKGADAVALLTEWNEFTSLDLRRLRAVMRRPVVIDGRNIWDPAQMREYGFVYKGIGR